MDIVMFCIFGLAIIAVIIFGRIFCGMVCPLGLLQSLIHKIPFPIKIKTFKADKYLRLIKYIGLSVIVISGILSVVGILPATNEESSRPSYGVIIGAILFLAAVIMQRPFCKYFCVVGATMSLGNKISLYKYRIDRGLCIECNKCTKVCKMDIIPNGKQNESECIRCGLCKKACPRKAIVTGFGFRNKQNK